MPRDASPNPIQSPRAAPWRRIATAAFFCAILNGGAAVASESHEFFESERACIASGKFSRDDCRRGFADSMSALRRRGLVFASRIDCVLRFHLCERTADPSGTAGRSDYTPVMLGIEIVKSRKGGEATPVLAVETPVGFFSRPQSPEPAKRGLTLRKRGEDEPAAKRFGRFDLTPIRGDWTRFSVRGGPPLAELAEPDDDRASESAERRRERLNKAPYIP